MYASEIALNHLIAGVEKVHVLDGYSTSGASVDEVPHVHCWHT